jgi:hypothetical protein
MLNLRLLLIYTSSFLFLFSILSINVYVESAFSAIKQELHDDTQNCRSTEVIAAELKIRFNSSLSCIEV